MDVPVLIITYRRFDFVLKILELLLAHNQRHVFISIDDYQQGKNEFEAVNQFLRGNNFTFELLKWEGNVGMERNIVEGSNWFFEKVPRGIVIEDDCCPTPGLFDLFPKFTDGTFGNSIISFFSNNIHGGDAFYFRPSYIPFFWGWYSTRELFGDFFRFYMQNRATPAQLMQFFRSKLLLRNKLISLLNYLSFDHNDIDTPCSWDSVFLYYQVLYCKPLMVPSQSLIENLGVADPERSTHTIGVPSWYPSIPIKRTRVAGIEVVKQVQDFRKDDEFLAALYADYPASILRLTLSLAKAYIKYRIRKKT
jgi:hypothetical protein